MAQVTVPTQVLSGEEDLVIPHEVLQKEVITRNSSAKMTFVPSAGHLLLLETPQETAAAIRMLAALSLTPN